MISNNQILCENVSTWCDEMYKYVDKTYPLFDSLIFL